MHQRLYSSWIFEQLPNNQRGATVFHSHRRPRVSPPVAASIKRCCNDRGHNHPHQTRVQGNRKSINNIVKGSMNAFNSLLSRNSGGGERQGDQQDNLTYDPAGRSFKEPDMVMIDPTGQLQRHLAVTTITQQDIDQLGLTQQPAATAFGAAGGMGVATVVVGTAEWRGSQAQPPRKTRGGGNPPQAPTEYSGIGAALRRLGHNMYDPEIIAAELKLKAALTATRPSAPPSMIFQ
jgi:hypothetical protein